MIKLQMKWTFGAVDNYTLPTLQAAVDKVVITLQLTDITLDEVSESLAYHGSVIIATTYCDCTISPA